tara:strand:+ start:10703 stop:11593 length:891 start_codon:yes stop_codon:yes gene_type:complete
MLPHTTTQPSISTSPFPTIHPPSTPKKTKHRHSPHNTPHFSYQKPHLLQTGFSDEATINASVQSFHVGGSIITTIRDFFNPDTCQSIINTCKSQLSASDTPLQKLPLKNQITFTESLFNKLRPILINQNIPSSYIDHNQTQWNLSYIGKDFKFTHYKTQGLFPKHFDAQVLSDDGMSRSKYSIIIYLNSLTKDTGNTHFYNDKKDPLPVQAISPTEGRIVIFDQNICHEGAKCFDDKYILRMDLYYTRTTPLTEQQQQALSHYRQAEAFADNGDSQQAIYHFNQASKLNIDNLIHN